MNTGKLWNIFCRVIDNYGDIGVCWRLSADLAARGQRVRLWVDDPAPLAWMAPGGAVGVEVRHWTTTIDTGGLEIGEILIEAFGCDIAPEFIAAYARCTRESGKPSIWVNLEYLSAERYVERCHGLPSPVISGPGAGLTKEFFYPGFTCTTGGLLRETDLIGLQNKFNRITWLRQLGIPYQGERLVALFCYEPPALEGLLTQFANDPQATRLLVTAGRATAAVQACLEALKQSQPLWNRQGCLTFSFLPSLTQIEFDHLLWTCDLNFVRGEDSLVRALWANKPFVWQIYPQDDCAHHEKLAALLGVLNAPPSWREFHEIWNGITQGVLPQLDLTLWQPTVTDARALLLQQDDQVERLLKFVTKNY